MSKRFDFVSSGDPAKDRELAKQFAQDDERIRNGECPYGDGLLVECADYEGAYECPQCHFVYGGPRKWA